MTKSILIYGDSNVYGEAAYNKRRLPKEQRWTTILADTLGPDYEVVAEGFSGRTAGSIKQGAWGFYGNGPAHFVPTYGSHTPLDVVIIALGANDCHPSYGRTVDDIMTDLEWYETIIEKYHTDRIPGQPPHIAFITPPAFRTSDYFPGSEELRAELFEAMAGNKLEPIIVPEVDLSEDGVHFSITGHQQMADNVHRWLEEVTI